MSVYINDIVVCERANVVIEDIELSKPRSGSFPQCQSSEGVPERADRCLMRSSYLNSKKHFNKGI